jgi:2,3-bisphosphoglycerate-dependent phosphoglycerate mutase
VSEGPTEYRQHRFAPPPGSTEILLVRHGESAPARPGEPFALVGGHGDPPLAPEGRWQAEQLGMRLAKEEIDAVYVTTLRRTHETAAPLATRLNIEPRVEADLREVYLGEWEGGVYRQKVAERDPRVLAVMEHEEWGLIPGGETTEALRVRAVAALAGIAEAHPDQRVVVVSHGGVIGALLSYAARARPFAFLGADNASISHLVVIGDRWIVRRFNDTGHLAGELSSAPQPPT